MRLLKGLIIVVFLTLFTVIASAQVCVDCHKKVTPNVVHDWELSKHSKNGVDCSACHGSDHTSNLDTAKVKIPTPDTCGTCHEERV